MRAKFPGEKSPYWQHTAPIGCPEGHAMIWLGSVYWICEKCKTVFVQVASEVSDE